jgi:membrane protein
MWRLLKRVSSRTIHDFSEDNCSSMAASLAYYTIFSLPSLLLIVIYIAGLVYGREAASGQIQERLSGTMGPQVAQEIQMMVHNVAANRSGGIIATALGLAGLIFSATSVLMQLQESLNRAWKVRVDSSGIRNFAMKRIESGLVIVAAGVLALVSVAAGSALAAFSRYIPFWGAANAAENLISLAIFAGVFAVILKLLPDVELEWSDVWLGAAFIAVLFEIGKFLIGLYIGHTGTASAYGAAGSLAMLLLWTYYSALVFLLGVEFTQAWVRERRTDVRPKRGAVLIAAKAAEPAL